MRYILGILLIVLFAACQRPVFNEVKLCESIFIIKPEGHLLLQQAGSSFEVVPDIADKKIEKVIYTHFDLKEWKLSLDSINTAAFGDRLHRMYGLTLKRNMGAFGVMMKSYFDYFDKFQHLSLESIERGGKTWQALLKKHNEENHYWQSFYTTHKENLIFITLFYALEAGERTIPTTEFFKYLDAVRFNGETSN